MKFAIQIHSGTEPASPAFHALQFSKSALLEGHQIDRVFFYGAGIFHAFFYPEENVPFLAMDWGSLAKDYGIDLVACVTAIDRRGLHQKPMLEGFRSGGLGLWMESTLAADRVLVF